MRYFSHFVRLSNLSIDQIEKGPASVDSCNVNGKKKNKSSAGAFLLYINQYPEYLNTVQPHICHGGEQYSVMYVSYSRWIEGIHWYHSVYM